MHPGRPLQPDRDRQRHRHPARVPEQCVRALLPGGQEPQQRPPAAPVWGWRLSSTLPSSMGPHQAGKSGGRRHDHHGHLSPRHPDFSSTQKYNVCLQLRAGVFCWVKPVGRAMCAADCAPADAAGLSPAASRNVPPQGKALPTVDTVRHPAAGPYGRLAVQTQGGRLLPERN